MQEVPRTVPVVRVNLGKMWLRPGQAGDHIRPDGHELDQDALDARAFRTNAVGAAFICHKHTLLNCPCFPKNFRAD
jgi:hypothetical protein